MKITTGLFVVCFYVYYAQAQSNPFTPPWRWEPSKVNGQRMYGKDVYKGGPYFFYGCTPSQGESLQNTFKTLGNVIGAQVFPDSQRGSSSRYGYSTWFGGEDKNAVSNVYSRIRDGYREPASFIDDQNPLQWRPEFVCFDRNMPDYPQAFLESIEAHCSGEHTTLTLPMASIIWLCPRFFTNPALPDFKPASQCQPLNDRGTKFAGKAPQAFYNSKAVTLVEVMAAKYIPVRNSRPPRSRDMNFLAALPDRQKLNAAVNYALYAQCESSHPFSSVDSSPAIFPPFSFYELSSPPFDTSLSGTLKTRPRAK